MLLEWWLQEALAAHQFFFRFCRLLAECTDDEFLQALYPQLSSMLVRNGGKRVWLLVEDVRNKIWGPHTEDVVFSVTVRGGERRRREKDRVPMDPLF